jgi:DNA-binding transcriptional LysR family regulator
LVVQRAPQLASMINLVAGGLGISIVPACMGRSRADAVRYLLLQATLGLAYRKGDNAVPAQNFLAVARTHAKTPDRSGENGRPDDIS